MATLNVDNTFAVDENKTKRMRTSLTRKSPVDDL